jgi:uncharacterized protein YhaN
VVERFHLEQAETHMGSAYMGINKNGDWVRYEDYQALQAERDALQAQLAERDKACAEWSEVSQRNYQRAKTAEADRDQWRSMWEKEQTDNEQLQAQLADGSFYQEKDIDAMIDRAQRAEAQLAKAREDALREAADFIKAKQAQQKMACVVWPEEILALIDTPTPAPSPDDLVKAAEMMVKAYREESDQTITAFYALEDAIAAMKGGDT